MIWIPVVGIGLFVLIIAGMGVFILLGAGPKSALAAWVGCALIGFAVWLAFTDLWSEWISATQQKKRTR
jgi:uncharacterized membrane protein SirB2